MRSLILAAVVLAGCGVNPITPSPTILPTPRPVAPDLVPTAIHRQYGVFCPPDFFESYCDLRFAAQ